MGEYIDIGVQTSILPLTIVLSSLILGIYAIFGVETENDDDDSDSGSGGLMQPIWNHLYLICLLFLFVILIMRISEPVNKNKITIGEININNTKKIW